MFRQCSKRLSAVTSVSPLTFAVAAMNRSAGSRWGKSIDRLANATSNVSGDSTTGLDSSAVRNHDCASLSTVTRPFSMRSMASQTLTGER